MCRYQSKVMVSDELPDGQMIDQWEPIGQDSVQTPLEVCRTFDGGLDMHQRFRQLLACSSTRLCFEYCIDW